MGAAYFSVVLWASLGEIPSIFEPFEEEERPVLAEAVEFDRGGFSIRPPTDWQKGAGARFLAPPVSRFRSSLVAERFPFDGDTDEYASELKDALKEKYEPFRVVAEDPFEGGDLKGRTLTVDYTEFKGGSILDLRTRFYLIDLEGSMIVAVATARSDRFDKIEGSLDASVKSVSIFGPGYEREPDGTCSLFGEGYSFRLRADMSLRHRHEDRAVHLTISAPGRVPVRLQILRLVPTGSPRAQAKTYAVKLRGAEVTRYEEAGYECWRILASKAESAIYQFLLGGEKDRFLISTTAPGETSEVARDVIEHIVKTFKITAR